MLYRSCICAEIWPLKLTDWRRCWMKETIQVSADPETPYDTWSLVRRMSWSTVSKASLRSSSSKERHLSRIGGIENVGEDLQESGLCGVSLSVGWLKIWKQFVLLKISCQLRGNNSFDDLGKEGQVWYRAIVPDVVRIKVKPLSSHPCNYLS